MSQEPGLIPSEEPSREVRRVWHEGFEELHRDVYDAGVATGRARQLIEEATGRSVVSPKNAKDLKQLPEKRRKQFPSLDQPSLFDEDKE